MKRYYRLAAYSVIALGLAVCCLAALRPDIFGAKTAADAPAFKEETDALTEFRLEREQLRAMQKSALDDIIDDDKSSAEIVSAAQTEKIEIMRRTEIEQTIVGILTARGFPECAAAVSDTGANVMIRASKLTDAETAVIMQLVLEETGASAGDIRIIPIK